MNQKNREVELEFFSDFIRELKKISQFYGDKERELLTKWSVFGVSMSKRDLINFYTEIDLFKSFQSLNVTAVKKILKKFVKVTGNAKDASDFLTSEAECCNFWNSSKISDDLTDKIEEMFTVKYSGGDRHRAMRRLRLRNFRSETFHSSALFAGCLWGTSIGGIVYALFCGYPSNYLYILGSLFLPFLALGLFSLNSFIFKYSYVNYRFVFQFDKRTALHECQFFALTGLLAFTFVFTSISVLNRANTSKTLLLPLPLLSTLIVFLNPFPWPWPLSRLWMIKTLFRIFSAPLHPVVFKDFFINDHLISLGLFFHGLLRSFGLETDHVTVKLIPILPYIPRILQCIRRYYDTKIRLNLLNSLKYSLVSLTILLKSTLHGQRAVLNVFQCLSTLFSLYWDNVMDFGFLQFETKNILLRNDLVVFRYKAVYYYVMVYNVLARFTWIVPSYYEKNSDVITFSLALIEIIRRFHWSFLRIEYEHLNNCNSFRAVEDLKVVTRTDDLFYKDMVYESRDPIEGISQEEDEATGSLGDQKIDHEYEYTELIDSV